MSRPASNKADPHEAPPSSQASPTKETLFLLSISRDEDDAAALRADLKRSSLDNYKIQHCANIDDAHHLLQVCGFDLVIVRLDDFQDKQAAVNLIRRADETLSVVALITSRLMANPEFVLPTGIDATCRIEDLSPSLVGSLVSGTLERKRAQKEQQRLERELELAIKAGQLGYWNLDVETGRLDLSENAAQMLGLAEPSSARFLDDLMERAYQEDQDRLKRIVELAIETQGGLCTSFRLAGSSEAGARLELSANYRPGGPRANAMLYGFVKRERQSPEGLQQRIESANAAIQKALALRDDAIQTASKELELLLQKVNALEGKSERDAPLAASASAPQDPLSITPPAPLAAAQGLDAPELTLDKSNAFHNVLKSIARHQKNQPDNTFPFDFSTNSKTDYSEPNPQQEGFLGAAERLVTITQNGHQLRVDLSVENDGAIECEREKELLFEILRELLTNVVKHARATECIIALFRDEDDWVLQVEDDGVGLENNLISISTPLNQIGLFRIRTKLALKGGQLDLTPTHPKGLIARARLPVSLSTRDAERA